MSKVYYHNITQGWYNENDYLDAAEESDRGDIVKMSFRGNAIVHDLIYPDKDIEEDNEHDWARKQFLDYFFEFHKQPFN